jgi:MoxR-like ATPase
MEINTNPINTEKLQQLIPILYKTKEPAIIWGNPGIGKSTIVKEFCKNQKIELIDVRLSQMAPEDLKGLPFFNHEQHTTTWLTPDFLPTEGQGILFLDELPHADQRLQTAAFQLILDRRIGDYILPKDWLVIAAGNYNEDLDNLFEMGAALKDRFTHILVDSSVETWLKWASKNKLHEAVLTFIKLKPEFLDSQGSIVESKEEDTSTIIPSPRSWKTVSDFLNSNDNPNDFSLLEDLIRGRIGKIAYAEFVHTLQELKETPDITVLFQSNSKKRLGIINSIKSIYGLYGLVYRLVNFVNEEENLEAVIDIMVAIGESEHEQGLEITTLGISMLLNKYKNMEGPKKLSLMGSIFDNESYQKYLKMSEQ